jgi:hypothetical protein
MIGMVVPLVVFIIGFIPGIFIIMGIVVISVIWLWVGLRVWLRLWVWRRFWVGLRLRFRTGCRGLWLRRWGRVWPRRHIVTDQQGKPATAAALAVIRQGNGDAPLNVRGAGGQGQDQEKVFHHSLSNLAKTENDLRYDFIRRSICFTFHSLGSISVRYSSR